MALPDMTPGQASVLIVPKAPADPTEQRVPGDATEVEFDAICRRYYIDMAQLHGFRFGEITRDSLPAEGDDPERWRASAMCAAA